MSGTEPTPTPPDGGGMPEPAEAAPEEEAAEPPRAAEEEEIPSSSPQEALSAPVRAKKPVRAMRPVSPVPAGRLVRPIVLPAAPMPERGEMPEEIRERVRAKFARPVPEGEPVPSASLAAETALDEGQEIAQPEGDGAPSEEVVREFPAAEGEAEPYAAPGDDYEIADIEDILREFEKYKKRGGPDTEQ